MFSKCYLADLRRRAIRKGHWYRILDRVERGILSLASRVVDRVGNSLLGRVLAGIVDKLDRALKGEFRLLLESYGYGRVGALVGQALGWGSVGAWGWLGDEGFARFLTVLEYNAPSGWGV